MQVTIKAKGQSEKQVVELTAGQTVAIKEPTFEGKDELVLVLGRQWRQIMESLVNKGLFRRIGKSLDNPKFQRTGLGNVVAGLVAERV